VTDNRKVWTVDELDAMTPAERRERFRESLLHPDDLPPAVRARFDAEAAEAVERHQAKLARGAEHAS